MATAQVLFVIVGLVLIPLQFPIGATLTANCGDSRPKSRMKDAGHPKQRAVLMTAAKPTSDTATEQKCPNCGSVDTDTRGRSTAFYAPPRDAPHGTPPKRIIDRMFRCSECAHEFSRAEEIDL